MTLSTPSDVLLALAGEEPVPMQWSIVGSPDPDKYWWRLCCEYRADGRDPRDSVVHCRMITKRTGVVFYYSRNQVQPSDRRDRAKFVTTETDLKCIAEQLLAESLYDWDEAMPAEDP